MLFCINEADLPLSFCHGMLFSKHQRTWWVRPNKVYVLFPRHSHIRTDAGALIHFIAKLKRGIAEILTLVKIGKLSYSLLQIMQ